MKFRMVDQIVSWEAGRNIRGIKAVSFEEYCLREALGMGEHLPESLVLEGLLQLGNWLVILSSEFSQCVLLRTLERVEFRSPLRPGERMSMEVSIRKTTDHDVLFDGRGQVDGRDVVIADGWRAERVPLSEYIAPEDLRVLYSEIHRPMMGSTP